MKVAIGVQYDGTSYSGFQEQKDPIIATVQKKLNLALSRVANEKIFSTPSGRTDAGVHALCQVVHFCTSSKRALSAWVKGSNSYLPRDISVLWAVDVPADFHARFSTIERHYRYVILNSIDRPALLRNLVGWYRLGIDIKLMKDVANCFLGEHDFINFRGSDCQARTTIRRINKIKIEKVCNFIIIDIFGNAFLHHMVRNIVGAMVSVGVQNHNTQEIGSLLNPQNDDANVRFNIAPTSGLYLARAYYEDKYRIPSSMTSDFFSCEVCKMLSSFVR